MICMCCGKQDNVGQPRTKGECVLIVYDDKGNESKMELKDCDKSWVKVKK